MALAQVTPVAKLKQAIQSLPVPQRLALIQWLTTHGPYWEDNQLHGENDWVEVNGEIVTQTAIGEAAICRARSRERELVSFSPSHWNITPLNAIWIRDETVREQISIPNHWELASVRKCLEANPEEVRSWVTLHRQMKRTFTQLFFAENAFTPLDGHPFFPSAAERIRVLLHTLNRFKTCFLPNGERSAEGHELYTNYFTGNNPRFSDSSTTEKHEFANEMTFAHPENTSQKILCPWHGKVQTPQFRIHFSWPIRSDQPLYIVYIGPKITKR